MSDEAPFPSRWALLARWWTLQTLFIFVATLVVAWQIQTVNGKAGHPIGLRRWDEFPEILKEHEYYLGAGGISIGLIVGQFFLMLPVRKPRPIASRGLPVFASLAIAGLAIGGLFLGAGSLLWAGTKLIFEDLHDEYVQPWAMAAICASAWLISTILLVRWSRGKTHEDVLCRTANRLFQGTIIEAAAAIPIEVMVRRRTDCYCSEETLFTLIVCGTVGTFVLGPAIWLPVLAKRRRSWHGGHCGFCGYEMSDLVAERCPECGTGWKRSEKVEVERQELGQGVKRVDQGASLADEPQTQ